MNPESNLRGLVKGPVRVRPSRWERGTSGKYYTQCTVQCRDERVDRECRPDSKTRVSNYRTSDTGVPDHVSDRMSSTRSVSTGVLEDVGRKNTKICIQPLPD